MSRVAETIERAQAILDTTNPDTPVQEAVRKAVTEALEGIYEPPTMTVPWDGIDTETKLLSAVITLMETANLTADAQARVAGYLASRYPRPPF